MNRIPLAIGVTVVSTVLVSFAVGGGAAAAPTKKAAGLVWQSDLDRAKQESARTGKPILLLSMFGEIDEKMPCANARTMRATLFPTPEFKDLVANDVILAWEKIRNVPKVTIEIDGKKIERTVRGNATMFLLRSDGKVLDAYPGLYTKEDFIPMVKESIAKTSKLSDEEVIAYHESMAKTASRRQILATMSKMAVESPALSLMGVGNPYVAKYAQSQDPKVQRFVRMAYQVNDTSLNPLSSQQVLMASIGTGTTDPVKRGELIRKLDSRTNVDSVRPVIHAWLATLSKLPTSMEAREPVFETILKVPYKDPMFGLGDIAMPGTPN